MDSKEVIIDTNFFMIPFQFNVDVIDEMKKKFPSYKLVVPKFIIDELYGLKHNNKAKVRLNANLALKLTKDPSIEIRDIPLLDGENVDDALIRISNVLATNDIELKKRAKEKGIPIVYLRQKKYITSDSKLL